MKSTRTAPPSEKRQRKRGLHIRPASPARLRCPLPRSRPHPPTLGPAISISAEHQCRASVTSVSTAGTACAAGVAGAVASFFRKVPMCIWQSLVGLCPHDKPRQKGSCFRVEQPAACLPLRPAPESMCMPDVPSHLLGKAHIMPWQPHACPALCHTRVHVRARRPTRRGARRS